MKTNLHGHMDYVKRLKQRFRVGHMAYKNWEIGIPVVEGRRNTWLHLRAVWHNNRRWDSLSRGI